MLVNREGTFRILLIEPANVTLEQAAALMVVFVWVSRQRSSETLTALDCQLAVSVFGMLTTQSLLARSAISTPLC